ncbi:MAG: SAM hydrolase/SAM-dependent halogenase family protein [Acidimicrobiales bacterium]
MSAGAGAVFLLTDYGQADELAGVVRAVLTRLAPGAPLVDLTHEVPPFDVRAGALALQRAVPHLGPGVVVGVVDPGVGPERRGVAIGVDDAGGTRPGALVGPDNGLLAWAADTLGGARHAVVLPPPAGDAVTFDGRDVFAPAAAALWRGAALADLGDLVPIAELVRLAPPRLERAGDAVTAEVLWVDRFGNVQLAATAADVAGLPAGAPVEVEAGGVRHDAVAARAFADVGDGLGVVVDANGHLAVVCDRAPAATVLAVHGGDLVTLRLGSSASS